MLFSPSCACCVEVSEECEFCTVWPSEFQVTISGISNGSECPAWLGTCDNVNDTFILDDASDLGSEDDCELRVAYDLGASGNCSRYFGIILGIGESAGNLVLSVNIYRLTGLTFSPSYLWATYETVISPPNPYDCSTINETISAAAISGETTICDATGSQVVVVAVP